MVGTIAELHEIARDPTVGTRVAACCTKKRPVPHSDHMPNTPAPHTIDTASTMPPGPGDAAATEHARQLVATGTDRSAAFWAVVERVARDSGVKP